MYQDKDETIILRIPAEFGPGGRRVKVQIRVYARTKLPARVGR